MHMAEMLAIRRHGLQKKVRASALHAGAPGPSSGRPRSRSTTAMGSDSEQETASEPEPWQSLALASSSAWSRRCLLRVPGPASERLFGPWAMCSLASLAEDLAPWHSRTTRWMHVCATHALAREHAEEQAREHAEEQAREHDPADCRASKGTEAAAPSRQPVEDMHYERIRFLDTTTRLLYQ